MTLLDIVLFLPLIGFLLLLFSAEVESAASRMAALVISLVIFVVSLGLLIAVLVAAPRRLQLRAPTFSGSAPRRSAITSASTA